MLYKRLKSIVLLSLSISSIYQSANEQNEHKSSIIKHVVASLASVTCVGAASGIYYYCVKKSEYDKILEQDLKNDLECNIIHYLDEDKILLDKGEIRRYSTAYNDLLSKIDKDNRVKEEGIYDTLKTCALFLIRTDARLRRIYKKPDDKAFITEILRYADEDTGACILSKSCFDSNSKNPRERKDYLGYYYKAFSNGLAITMEGQDSKKYGEWLIGMSPQDLTLSYASIVDH